jgi:hypothetical protein
MVRIPLLLVALAALAFTGLEAQSRSVEVGADLGFQWDPDSDVYLVSIPAQQLRVGLPVGQRGTVEPRVQFALFGGDGADGVLDLALALRYDLGDGPGTLPYVAIVPEMLATFGDFSGTEFGLGAAFGIHFARSERFAWRTEVGVSRFFDADATLLKGLVGLTFYVHR